MLKFPMLSSMQPMSVGSSCTISIGFMSTTLLPSRWFGSWRRMAKALTERLKTFEGVLVWGAGDNFHRCSENGGPLSNLTNMVVLDQHPQVIIIGDRRWITG